LFFGPDFDTLDPLPPVVGGKEVGNAVWETYDKDVFTFPGYYDTDSRICLEARAPKPCTILAAVINMGQYERV
jgi:hypothetical protein